MSTESLELLVTLKCTARKTSVDKKLVCSPYPTRVSDIKEHIQRSFSIPKCMQRLQVNGQSLSADSQLVSQLYLRNQDAMSVTFLSEADVDVITKFTTTLKSVIATLKELTPALFCEPDFNPFGAQNSIDYLVCQFLDEAHTVALIHLAPWEVAEVEANRRMLIQEGTINLLLELYALLLQSPFEKRVDCLQFTETTIVQVISNFIETAYARQMIARKGGFKMMLQSLMHYPGESFLYEYEAGGVFDKSVGAIANMIQLRECRLVLAEDHTAVDRLLLAIRIPLLSVSTEVLLAETFVNLSFSLEAHPVLTKQDTISQLLQFCDACQMHIAPSSLRIIRYFLCLLFARLVLLSAGMLSADHQLEIFYRLEALVLDFAPRISSCLEDLRFSLISMVPVIDVFFVPMPRVELPSTTEDIPDASATQNAESGMTLLDCSMSLAVSAIEVQFSRKRNRDLAVAEGLLDFIVLLPHHVPAEWKEQCQSVVALFRDDQPLPVPRLSSIAKASLATSGYKLKEFQCL